MMNISPEAARLLDLKPIKEYKRIMLDGLRNSFPALDLNSLDDAITYNIINQYNNPPGYIENNYTKQKINGTVIDILQYIQNLEPIMTSSGVLFKKHKEADNPLCKMIIKFLDQRAAYKKEMFKYPKGSAEFEKYNLLQLLEKLNAKLHWRVI